MTPDVGSGDGLPQESELPGNRKEKKQRYRFMELLKEAGDARADTLEEIAAAPDVVKYPLVHDWLYPGAWLLVGRPKIGKSWLQLQLMLAVAEGETFLGYKCGQAEVLGLFAEDDNQRLKERLTALGVARVPAGCYVFNREKLKVQGRKCTQGELKLNFHNWLGCWLDRHPKVKLVLVDTEEVVRQMWKPKITVDDFGAHRVTSTDYQQVMEFDEFALKRGLVISLTNHSGKLRGKAWLDPFELINRSMTAMAGASGGIVVADPIGADPMDPDQHTRVFAVRGRDVRKDIMLAVHQERELPQFVSDGPYYEVRQSQLENHVLECLDQLMTTIEEHAYVTGGQLAAAAATDTKTVYRTLSRMIAKGRQCWKNKRLMSKPGKGGGYRLEQL